MKTLGDIKRESRAVRKAAGNKETKDIEDFLSKVSAWEIPETVTQDHQKAQIALDNVEQGFERPLGFACDHCFCEMVGESGFTLMSNPPCRWVTCPACGWRTTQSSRDRIREWVEL